MKVNLPVDIRDLPTWVDYVTNGLALVVVLAGVFACVSAVGVAWTTYRPAKKVGIG